MADNFEHLGLRACQELLEGYQEVLRRYKQNLSVWEGIVGDIEGNVPPDFTRAMKSTKGHIAETEATIVALEARIAELGG